MMAPHKLPPAVIRFQDELAGLLGRAPNTRSTLVMEMLRRKKSDVTAYWLQLIVAAGIATLGLVLGSSAVIIGAMLIAPLMEPIVNLGMGLAVGSPFLVLRSISRVASSVVAVILGSAFLVWLIPFHELNAEIAARTSPTALDLVTAGFCALAGVYATLRPGSDTTTTAAGTSIGISLVPPLCASGYGVGIGAWPIAGGAALLFLTNFAAITFVSTLSFVGAGMNQINVADLERQALAEEGPAKLSRAVARRIARVFESQGGPLLRFAMPVILLGALYIPLREALDEVAWQVRVRAQIETALEDVQGRLVEKRLRVERGEVELMMVLIGNDDDVLNIRAKLDGRIREVAGVAPKLEVYAVPDAATIAGLAATFRTPKSTFVPPPPPISPTEAWDIGSRAIEEAVANHWPLAASGPVFMVRAQLGTKPLRVEVMHHGAALGADAREVLESAISKQLARKTVLAGRAIPTDALRTAEIDPEFIAQLTPLFEAVRDFDAISLCVTEVERLVPTKKSRGGDRNPISPDVAAENVLRTSLSKQPRVAVTQGDEWSIRFVRGKCAATSTSTSTPAVADAP